MADTVITPAVRDHDSGANAMGWTVAVILLLGLILFGIFVWPGVGRSVVPATTTDTNPGIDVNVRLPEGITPGAMQGSGGSTQNSGTNQQGGTQTQ